MKAQPVEYLMFTRAWEYKNELFPCSQTRRIRQIALFSPQETIRKKFGGEQGRHLRGFSSALRRGRALRLLCLCPSTRVLNGPLAGVNGALCSGGAAAHSWVWGLLSPQLMLQAGGKAVTELLSPAADNGAAPAILTSLFKHVKPFSFFARYYFIYLFVCFFSIFMGALFRWPAIWEGGRFIP